MRCPTPVSSKPLGQFEGQAADIAIPHHPHSLVWVERPKDHAVEQGLGDGLQVLRLAR